ncbi:helix-turn-helix domain-containing protein [Bradyrhizobium diazoefficiens]|nr:helix-turn-helix domain-containing protein [Bradyrhizobium diazoefficiens]QQO18605.1 helix-turn-helix domain-containing protein [Bradyrhizobium diazoefficiens]
MSQQLERPKGAMSVNDFALWAGIGRTSAWKEIREGNLRAVKVSARTIIRFTDAENWLATRPQLPAPNAQSSNTTK